MNVKRGEIWVTSFNPARGSEQKGIRPALVVQNNIGNQFSPNTIILAISSKKGNKKLDIKILPSSKNNLKEKSFVKCSQILTISKKRLLENLGEISDLELEKVDYAMKISLGL